jgi:hypothetical protein
MKLAYGRPAGYPSVQYIFKGISVGTLSGIRFTSSIASEVVFDG